MTTNLETFLVEARKLPGVINASSIARSIVGAQNSTVGYFHWEGKDPNAIIPFEIVNSNYELIETLGLQMKEGRSFEREFPQDTASIIFNEAGLEVMGLNDPIGKTFNLWGKDYRIIGITTNFHFESLHEKVKPLFFKLDPEEAERIMIRLEPVKKETSLVHWRSCTKDSIPVIPSITNFSTKSIRLNTTLKSGSRHYQNISLDWRS